MKPIDIEMKKFKKATFGGYNTDDVNEFLDEVVRHYEEMQRDNFKLEKKVADLTEEMDYYKTMEKTLQNTMILAEKTSQETRDKATEEAEKIILEGTFESDQMVEEAREEAYLLKQNIEVLKTQYDTAKNKMKELLQAQLESLDSDVMTVEELNSLPEDNLDYTKEYQIIDEEDTI